MTIMNGTEDGSVMTCDLERWKQHAEKKCGFERIKGSHFFIIENIEETVAIINNVILLYMDFPQHILIRFSHLYQKQGNTEIKQVFRLWEIS